MPLIVLVAGGTGGFGKFLTKELLKFPVTYSPVRVLTREESKSKAQDLVKEGAELVTADYNDHASLVKALNGVTIVISALGGAVVGEPQLALVKAAKEAGVTRFIPSEYGVDPSKNTPFGFYAPKLKVQQAIKDAGLEYILYGNGLFTDADLIPEFGFDFANDKATIVGDGNTEISWSWRADVARFIAETAWHPEFKNKVLNFEGDSKNYNAVVHMAETRKRTNMDVTYVPIDEKLEKSKGDPGLQALSEIQAATASGYGKVTNPSYVEFVPRTVMDWMKNSI